ncbi:MAG: hypothetical protein KA207_11245, partial [Burkholderiaceae bacterium]|nr:hypothetical protein [Burkholderiaceae bacterium]
MNKINTTDAVVSFGTQFVLTTNQGVVGSIPASRTKKTKSLQRKLQAFSLVVHCLGLEYCHEQGLYPR